MPQWLVPDGLWELVAPLLPSFNSRPQGGWTAPCDERAVFTAVVYVLTSGCAWRHLPETFGRPRGGQGRRTRRRHLLAVLATDGEVSLEHFAGLPSQAAAVLLNAIEIALSQYRPSRGSGQAVIDDAGLQVTVRPGRPRTTVTVELAEGRLTGPDLRVSVTPAGRSPAVSRQAAPPDTPEPTWSVA